MGYEADIATADADRPADKEHFCIIITGAEYDERKKVGEAILAATERLSSPGPVPLGQFAGFALELAFDVVSREFQCAIVGHLRHTVTLGDDPVGNVARIDNAIDSLQSKCEGCREQLANTRTQMNNVKAEAAKPFAKETELLEKSARLAELDAGFVSKHEPVGLQE